MGKKSKFLRKEVWRMMKAAKGITVLVLLIQIVTALAAVIYTDSLNRLFTAITEKQWSRSLLILFLAVGGLLMIQDILNGVANYVTDVQTMKAQKGYMTSFLEKVNGLSAKQCLEPHTLDMINSAREGRETGVEFMVHVELLFSYYLFYYGFMMAYLYTIHPLLAAVILIAYVPSVLTYRLKNKISVQRNQKAAIYRRQRETFYAYASKREFLKETRFWKADKMFQNKLSEAGKNFEREQIKGFNRQNRVSLFCNFTYLIGFAAILSVIFYLISIKSISVAEVATVLTVVISIYDSMDELMNFHVARMAENMSGLWSMYEIMQLSTADGAQELQGEGYEIQMDNVSFSYPDAETQALQNVSLHLKNGETVAIVGENGSGKTTLSKVLCGLYAPTSGEIRVNGQPGEVIKRSSLMQRVSAVFQDFNRYPMTVRENIRISDVRKQEKEGELDRLSRLSGIYEKVMSEDAGYDTLLSKEFGGTDWSGGLWQRLAIARSNYKDSSLLVFDEPTAAIDPLEEIDIMEKMMSNCQGKTAVLVTHRIGAARLADRVIVMAHGKICETGTHEELLSRGGEYARMFECQKQWYV